MIDMWFLSGGTKHHNREYEIWCQIQYCIVMYSQIPIIIIIIIIIILVINKQLEMFQFIRMLQYYN